MSGSYSLIVADPPWRFRTWTETNQTKSASRHYALMDLDQIKAYPVLERAADDCTLLLWAIDPMLPQALEVMDAWGFTFKTVGFHWVKLNKRGFGYFMSTGYWTRANSELCLLGTRGHAKRAPEATSVSRLIVSRRRAHSQKPIEFYQRAEELVTGSRLELFSRTKREGWDCEGFEVDKFDPVSGRPATPEQPSLFD